MRYSFLLKVMMNKSKSSDCFLKGIYEVGFNSNRKVERFGEYGSSVRTNRPSLRPSKSNPKYYSGI